MLPSKLVALATGIRAPESALLNVEKSIGLPLPSDYRELLLESDGLEGFLTENEYIILWKAGDIAEMNEGYGVREFAPGVTLIGTDGAGNGYGFISRSPGVAYVSVPLVGMAPDTIHTIASSLEEFIDRVAVGLALPQESDADD